MTVNSITPNSDQPTNNPTSQPTTPTPDSEVLTNHDEHVDQTPEPQPLDTPIAPTQDRSFYNTFYWCF